MKALVTNKYQNTIYGTNKGIRFSPKNYAAVPVPNVVGMTFANATAALTSAGLMQNMTGVVTGVVQSQSPVATTSVAPHSLVTCVFI